MNSTKLIECEYCGRILQEGGNLKRHQLTKTCRSFQIQKFGQHLDIKPTYSELELENKNLKEICEKYKSNVEWEKRYIEVNAKLEVYISLYGELKEEYNEEHKDTKKLLTHLASKPTVTTHNTQNNVFNSLTPLDLSEERIKKALPMYTMPHYLRGAEGMADFLIENLLTDEKGNSMYACNDKNRCYFQYKDLSGAKIDDIKCQRLIDTVKPYLAPRVSAFKKERDDWIMETYGDSDEAYEFSGGQNLIGRKQMENHKLNNKAFDIAKIMVLRHK